MQRFQFPSLETSVQSKAAPWPKEVRHKPLPALLCSNELKLAAELGDVKPCSAGRGHSSPEERKGIYIAHTRSMLFILHHRLFSPFSSQYCRLVFTAKPKRLGKQSGGRFQGWVKYWVAVLCLAAAFFFWLWNRCETIDIEYLQLVRPFVFVGHGVCSVRHSTKVWVMCRGIEDIQPHTDARDWHIDRHTSFSAPNCSCFYCTISSALLYINIWRAKALWG